jgi:hypothetical protein
MGHARDVPISPCPIRQSVHVTVRAYPTPEEAALAEWDDYPQAEARVLDVTYVGKNEADVITDTVPSHPMRNRCSRTPEGWIFLGDDNSVG